MLSDGCPLRRAKLMGSPWLQSDRHCNALARDTVAWLRRRRWSHPPPAFTQQAHPIRAPVEKVSNRLALKAPRIRPFFDRFVGAWSSRRLPVLLPIAAPPEESSSARHRADKENPSIQTKVLAVDQPILKGDSAEGRIEGLPSAILGAKQGAVADGQGLGVLRYCLGWAPSRAVEPARRQSFGRLRMRIVRSLKVGPYGRMEKTLS
jgi:hypothetical protein